MATLILTVTSADHEGACFQDSVTGQVFGPVFDDEDQALRFEQWALAEHDDPRRLGGAKCNDLFGDWVHEDRLTDHDDDAPSLRVVR